MNENPIPKFELVLPCYNESRSLRRLVERAVAAARARNYGPGDFRLILVDNGSTDETTAVLGELGKSELAPWFSSVTVTVNQGYGFGLHSGLRASTARFVGWSHADEQCDPADALTALARLEKSAEPALVKGTRSGRNWKDVLVSRVFELFARVFLGLSVHEINAQPKVFPRELLAHLGNPPSTFAFDLYALYHARKLGWPVLTVPVKFPPRVHGLSRWASTFVGRYKTILGMIRYMWTLRGNEGRL